MWVFLGHGYLLECMASLYINTLYIYPLLRWDGCFELYPTQSNSTHFIYGFTTTELLYFVRS